MIYTYENLTNRHGKLLNVISYTVAQCFRSINPVDSFLEHDRNRLRLIYCPFSESIIRLTFARVTFLLLNFA